MSRVQQLLRKILPASLAEDMRAESQTWMVRCPQYGRLKWHTVYRRQ
jgi:hypothetical protein